MASLRLIAESTKTSPATVSRALSDHPEVEPETRRRVLLAAKALGYKRPAPKRTETTFVALVQTSASGFWEYDALLMGGLIRAFEQHRLNVVWLNLFTDKLAEEGYAQFFRRKGVRGVALRAFGDSRHVVEAIADEGVPAVVLGERFDRADINWARVTGLEESRRAVEHLIALKHRRIALLTNSRYTSDHAERIEGYQAALTSAGLGVDEELMLRGSPTIEGGAAAINRLLSLPSPPTALYTTDPASTLGALRRCHEIGLRVPADFSIVGFDDHNTRMSSWPMYSAVCQPTSQLGFDAGTWLAGHLAGHQNEPLRLELRASFEVLQTTGVAPAEAVRVLPDGTRPTPV